MPHLLSELADLGTYLIVVCVPIAVAAITISVGRALAERIRRGKLADSDKSAMDARAEELARKLVNLERAIEVAALEVERLGEQQRFLAKHSSLPTKAPKAITPH